MKYVYDLRKKLLFISVVCFLVLLRFESKLTANFLICLAFNLCDSKWHYTSNGKKNRIAHSGMSTT